LQLERVNVYFNEASGGKRSLLIMAGWAWQQIPTV